MVTSKKAGKAAPRMIRAASRAGVTRHRSHALVPEHVGELGSVALLAMAILGVAGVITGIALVVAGLTMGSRYGTSAPPNVAELGIWPLLGGIGLILLGVALAAAAVGTFAEVRRARPIAAGLDLFTALLAVVGAVLVWTQPAADVILAATLLVTALLFGAAGVILLRPSR